MNVLITGSCGYLGRKTCTQLEKSSEIDRIIGIDISSAHPDLEGLEKYTHYKRDIRDPEIKEISKKESVHTIIHLASILNPPPGMTEDEVESIEIDGAKNLLNATKAESVEKFIFTSSGAAYGYYPDNPDLIEESHRTKGSPGFPYSLHKAEIEKIISKFKLENPKLKTLILRAGTILGENTNGPIADYFSKTFLVGVKGFKSPFCFVLDNDVASAIFQGAVSKELEGAYNLSGDGVMSLKEIATSLKSYYVELPKTLMEKIISILHTLRLTQFNSYQVNFICYRPVLDNTKLKKSFKNLPSKNSEEVFNIYKSSRLKT